MERSYTGEDLCDTYELVDIRRRSISQRAYAPSGGGRAGGGRPGGEDELQWELFSRLFVPRSFKVYSSQ